MKSNYIVILDWMVTELDLKGNDLLTYALIYGFTQDEENEFRGSRKYIADWLNASLPTVDKSLKNLLDRGLLSKRSETMNGVIVNYYKAIKDFTGCKESLQGVKKLDGGCKETLHNNTNNNTNNNIISKDIIPETEDDYASKMYSAEDFKNQFLGSATKKVKPKNQRSKSLYSKCQDEITAFTNDVGLSTLLYEYLELRLNMKDKPIYGVNQWKGLLNKLVEIAGVDGDYNSIVKQSIERGYASFYPVAKSTYKKQDVFNELGETSCAKKDEDYIDEEF